MIYSSKKLTIACLIFALGLIGGASWRVYGAGLPFGGFVLNSIPCTCYWDSYLLTVSGPVGGQFLYRLGTPQYPYAQLPRSGVWVLGLYSPVAICWMQDGKGCAPWGAPIGTITPTVGTSL